MSAHQESKSSDLTPDLTDHVGIDDSISNSSTDMSAVVMVTDLLKVQSWLDRQLYDYNSQIESAETHCKMSGDVEKLHESLSVLHGDLVTEASRASLKDLTVKRLQLGQTLNRILRSSDGAEETSFQGDQAKKECLEELLMQQQDLVSQTIKKSEEVQELNDSLAKIKKRNFELKVNNRKLMAVIKERHTSLQEQAKSFSENEKGQNMKSHLQKLVDKIVIQRQVLKGIILGSGVNWQQDNTLREQVIGLGEPLDI